FTHSPRTALSPLSLHDALPIFFDLGREGVFLQAGGVNRYRVGAHAGRVAAKSHQAFGVIDIDAIEERFATMQKVPSIADSLKTRSEEHTSELQSRFDLVCRLLL